MERGKERGSKDFIAVIFGNEGVMRGRFEEFDKDGTLVFEGVYHNNVRV